MLRVKKVLIFLARNFVFVVGGLFILFLGFIYVYLRPQGIIYNGIFLLIAIGWIIFMTSYADK